MRVLIACEESQAVCKAFRKLGHEAYSCDILPCSGGHPEWHIQGDVLEQLDKGWDLMIAHPPCTYLSNAGARFLYPKGILNNDRYEKGLEAKDFFMRLLNAPIEMIAIENPIQSKIFGIKKYDQIIEPYYFGHPFKKKTCLWLKNLPKLECTELLDKPQSTKIAGNWFNKGGKDRQKNRSKTFPGIAKAMAEQWSELNFKEVKKIEETIGREMTAEEEYVMLEERRKALKQKMSEEKIQNKIKANDELKLMNEMLIDRDADLRKIKKEIYSYNRLKKADKINCQIREKINEILDL